MRTTEPAVGCCAGSVPGPSCGLSVEFRSAITGWEFSSEGGRTGKRSVGPAGGFVGIQGFRLSLAEQ